MCVGVFVGVVYVFVVHSVWCVFCLGGCGCVDFFAVHKQAQHAGTARCIFEKCTVKNYFVISQDWHKVLFAT